MEAVIGTHLDLWRSTMREYAEEFLGAADATGDGGVTIDCSRDAPFPFTEESVLGYAEHPGTLPAGRACLKLAWRWRHELGLA